MADGTADGIADGAAEPPLAAALASAAGDASEGGLDVATGAPQPTMDTIAQAMTIPRLMIPPRDNGRAAGVRTR